MELVKGVNYRRICNVLESSRKKSVHSTSCITKTELRELLRLAQSDRERECLKYAVFKGSGLTPTAARRELGLENMGKRVTHMVDCIQQAAEIERSFEELAQIRAQCVTASSSSESDPEDCQPDSPPHSLKLSSDAVEQLSNALKESNLNWFEFCDRIMSMEIFQSCLWSEVSETIASVYSDMKASFTDEKLAY